MIAVPACDEIQQDSPALSSGISCLQRMAIAHQIRTHTAHLSQENQPRPLAAIAAPIVDKYLGNAHKNLIRQFRAGDGVPYLLLRGLLDLEGLPPTPSDDRSPAEAGWHTAAATMLGYLKLCGAQGASFVDEMGGRLFHMVMPAQNSEKSLARSTKALNFHTEVVNGYFAEEQPAPGSPIAPDVFALACLRNPHRVPTTVLPLAAVLRRLDAATVIELMRPAYHASSQSSFDRQITINHVPCLVPLHSGHIGMRFSHSRLEGSDPGSCAALDRLRLVMLSFDASHAVVLAPGDVLVLNNRLCLHGRSEVGSSSRFDGNDRWLLRLYGYSPPTLARARFIAGSTHIMAVRQELEQHPAPAHVHGHAIAAVPLI